MESTRHSRDSETDDIRQVKKHNLTGALWFGYRTTYMIRFCVYNRLSDSTRGSKNVVDRYIPTGPKRQLFVY